MTPLVRALNFLAAAHELLAWAISTEGTDDHAPQIIAARGFIEAALASLENKP